MFTSANSLVLRFAIIALLHFICVASVQAQPNFENSIVSTDFDFITAEDPSAFEQLQFLGRRVREMPDKRNDELIVDDTFVFAAGFSDGSEVEIWAHPSFGSLEIAKRHAEMLRGPLGKLPGIMRKRLSHVVIHKGDETAFGESLGHFFVLYSENMQTRIRNHDLEETVFHESVHATLDAKHASSKQWLNAQREDAIFITNYAAKKPKKEDLAESALFAYTVLRHPGRLPAKVEDLVKRQIPNRIAFFETVFGKAPSHPKPKANEDPPDADDK